MKKSLFLIPLIILSCRNEQMNEQNNLNNVQHNVNFNTKNGVLKFTGRFSDVKNFVKSNDSEKENSFINFYEQGFRSKDYFDSEKSLEVLSQTLSTNEKNKLKQEIDLNDEIESNRDFIGNEDFREILNEKYQVQVNDSIYQYTKNGIFMTHIDNIKNLESFIEKNQNITIPEGKSLVSENIISFRPYKKDFESYKIEFDHNQINSIHSEIPNLNQCSPEKGFWEQILGKTYSCEYRFSRKRKLNTTFGIEDYYLFFDVYAQSKFKQRTWFGWFSSRDAQKVVLNVKHASISLDRKDYSFSLSGENAVKRL